MVHVTCPSRLDAMALAARLRTHGYAAERSQRDRHDGAREVTVDAPDAPDATAALRDQVQWLTPEATISLVEER